MMICPDCARLMRCKKNDVTLVYAGGYIRMSDLYECECGNRAVWANANLVYAPDYIVTEDDIIMEER